MPEGTNSDPHAGGGDRRTLRQRLSHHYHHSLDGGGRGAVVGAVIGFFGVLITVGVTAAVALHDAGESPNGAPPARPDAGVGSPTPAGPAPTTSSPSAGSSAGTPTPSATSTVPPADEVRWTGPVRFDDEGIDLDAVPPTVRMDWSVFDSDVKRVSSAGDGPLTAEQGLLARWPGPGTPTRQQCADLISTQGDERVHIPVGRIGCLSTSKDHIAMLTVTGFKDDTFAVTGRVTVWATPGETES